MGIVHCVSNVEMIKHLLDYDKIATINVLGRMRFTKDWKIIVDNINRPKGFILKSDEWNIIYSPEDEVAKNMLENMNLKGQDFAGVLKKYYDLIKNREEIDWEEQCYLYYMDKKDLDLTRIKHEVKELRVKDALVVNEYYTYKSEDSLEYIIDCIKNRPSSAIFDENGVPISWAVVREDGSMGIMYTKEEYRGKGLAVSVSIDLAKKVFDIGWIPYVHILVDNIPSIKLAESIGFKKYGEIVWFGVK
ncbi:GNAT family N-acetyltransferase [Caloranaerobacter azorensis]|uniref:GNAT family N-acetyltransferase n=1 Tax=Caloranaerobacter azorensis TaxID=116090 RepID=UPI00116023EF|nr:GNAT family N-acetyltransferase [Caloranaerobacter azorensis]